MSVPEAANDSDAAVTNEPTDKMKDLESRNASLQSALDECRSELAVAECVKESLVTLQRQNQTYSEELATMQQLLSEAHDEAGLHRTSYEHELAKAKAIVGQLEAENHELKIQAKLNGQGDAGSAMLDKDSLLGSAAVLSDATKSFARRMKSNLLPGNNGAATTSPTGGQDDGSMRRAHEDTELLKSIVVPLEEQIGALKDKLRETDGLLREHEFRQAKTLLSAPVLADWLRGQATLDVALAALVEKSEAEELAMGKAEAAAQMYLTLMSTRYSLLNMELSSLRKEHSEVVQLLERERASSKALREEAVVASSERIRAEREHLAEVARMQQLLTDEQKQELLETAAKTTAGPQPQQPQAAISASGGITTSVAAAATDSSSCSEVKSSTTTSSPDSSPARLCMGENTSDDDSSSSAMTTALSNAVASSSTTSTATRIVSSVEWDDLQKELARVRTLLGVAAVDSGGVVGSELYRDLQGQLIEAKKQKAVQAKAVEKLKQEVKDEAVYRRQVEERWNERAEQHKAEADALTRQIQELEGLLEQVRISYSAMYEATRKDLKCVTADRTKIVKELKRLQEETDILTGKHSARADEMQNEAINLPDTMEEMQLQLLQYRQDVIAAKIAKERLEERLRSEVSFLRAQMAGEQQAKEAMEDQLTAEAESLRGKIQRLEACKRELDEEQQRRKALEGSEQRRQESYKSLQSEMEAHLIVKQKLETEIHELKNRIGNLQQELDNSVAVQTDFVRLSQSLQMELEKIRQAEKEVRWQHEDDVDSCQNCKLGLAANKRKHHCRHCGRIFCSDCVTKTVPSGQNRRPAKVCDVCHTLLVQNSAPYFSTEAPQVN